MSYPDPDHRDHAMPEIFIVLMIFVLAVFALKFIGELPCREKPKAVPTTPLLPRPKFKPRTTPGIRMDRVDRVALHQYSR